MGHNFLSDWTPAEQKAIRGYKPLSESAKKPTQIQVAVEALNAYETTYDWCSTTNDLSRNVCTPIKNQGRCGGCYSFSATEAVESAISIYNSSSPVEYSTQQCISCSSAYGNGGCDGGNYEKCWDYFKTNALETEADYPYSSASLNYGTTPACTANTSIGVVETDSTPYTFVG